MPHVVTKLCVGVKDKACVQVCPADCFYEGPEQLYIKPDECIDCQLCVPVCPAEAIFREEELPPEHAGSAKENDDATKDGALPNITEK